MSKNKKRGSDFVSVRKCRGGKVCIVSQGAAPVVADLLLNALARHLYNTTPFYVSTDTIVETAAGTLESILQDIEAEDER